ncbi:MAG: trigger factor [Neomegalonema sp.]|nr:trigger factor [Neomegalonema sp.]
MQVEEITAEGLQRSYKAVATAAIIEEKINEKIEDVRKDVEIKGFRKGKAPAALLKKMYGESLHGEVLQELVDSTLRDHLESTGHRPATQPEIKATNESFKPGDDLHLEISYEILPQIPETNLSEIALERFVVEVEDKAVDEALESLAKNAKNFETKEGAAEAGDQVVIDFLGKIDDVAFEGGAAEDFALELGSGQFIPGFEDQLIGLSAGEEKNVEVSFPENYGASELAGKPAIFETKVKEVKAPKAAEIDDELAKTYGQESLDALKEQLKERLAAEYKDATRGLLKRKLLDVLSEKKDFDLPKSMVEPEAKAIAHQLWHEEHKDHDAHDHSHGEIEPTAENVELAERRVRLGLILADIGQKNEIHVKDEEVSSAIMRQARQYPGQERAFFEFVQKNPQMMQNIRAPLFEDKVVDFIFEMAQIAEKPISADDLRQEIEKLEEESED